MLGAYPMFGVGAGGYLPALGHACDMQRHASASATSGAADSKTKTRNIERHGVTNA